MKLNSLIALSILGLLTIGSVQAFADTSQNGIPLNTLMTEKTATQSNDTENTLKEKAINAFKEYFNETLDTNNLTESVQFIKKDVDWNSQGKDYYQLVWNNSDKDYYANIELDGKIFDIGIIYNTSDNSQKVDLIDLDEAKKIASDFLKEKNLTTDVNNLEFLGEATIGPDTCGVVYGCGQDNSIIVSVDSATKKVRSFSYHTLNDGKKAVELNNYRQTGQLG